CRSSQSLQLHAINALNKSLSGGDERGLCARPAGWPSAGIVDPGGRRIEMGGAAGREPIVAYQCDARGAA
ncbi:hypothetical protein LTR94_032317, partial [Friedmanniomyces endolithicus]